MPLAEGELVVFADERFQLLQRLTPGKRLNTYWGYIDHDEVLGLEPGSMVRTSGGKKLYVFYPTVSNYILKMPRKSGIIYPKDLGIIMVWTDIGPGDRVLLGGVGSGALLIAVLRQVGTAGKVVAYDLRQDMLDCATENIKTYFGTVPSHLELKLGDIYEATGETGYNRLLLDVPEPWKAVRIADSALVPGGILCSYLPSIVQARTFTTVLQKSGSFGLIETLEVMLRQWHVEGRAVRPQHRMVGHTGFLTFARKLSGGE
ncbi:tRNA (adenine-N1)-methyltransferase [Desulfofundulus thermocisternus]|uniref:tRNA (adenine-N1)-methyltransferase n=1 Tax=Desulfofundulus thermocisternus TaxID=42471 RepID=UPI0019DEEB49|nr:tRNA (adenine-N1)-methyltransferase [Desulfofundulus thermocisternus]MBE3585513.1 tRNA (adenine-N1)-methyltransferase [Thermoanaerobacter sp.]MCS5696217.1 tRNA (adenine-N1)-methyltransferase [Desulfofundulus thermocisternus]